MNEFKNEEYYAKGQASTLFEFWPEQAEVFIIGGPADGNEAQTIHERYPEVKCIGFEPRMSAVDFQVEHHFPGKIYPLALWDKDVELDLFIAGTKGRSSSVCRPGIDKGYLSYETVQGRTLDSLNNELGPWHNVVLWLDIEWAEVPALRGARNLLYNHVRLANIETVDNYDEVNEIMEGHGFQFLHRWNHKSYPGRADIVFGR